MKNASNWSASSSKVVCFIFIFIAFLKRLTPEERFEVRVKDPYTEEMYMVEELIQALNQKVDALQDDMIYVKHKLTEHEQLLQLNPKFRVRKASESFSVSGSIRQNDINT